MKTYAALALLFLAMAPHSVGRMFYRLSKALLGWSVAMSDKAEQLIEEDDTE